MEPVFLRLSDDDLLDRVQRGDTQNSNESLHSLIWKRVPKHLPSSLQIVEMSTALSVIQRNSGNVGLVSVLESLGVTNTELSRRLLERLDERKERKMLRKRDPEVKKRRQVLRGMKNRGEDQLWEKGHHTLLGHLRWNYVVQVAKIAILDYFPFANYSILPCTEQNISVVSRQ